ncbi:MAG: hypothetical protein RQ856_06410 [Candidatus Izemoplasmatales bacterium]|nr:hypothetical protein [Candidatus Izemoplasmatales bacterium]
MDIRIDDDYEKVYLKEDGDSAFWFYSSFFSLGINKDMSEDEKMEIIKEDILMGGN